MPNPPLRQGGPAARIAVIPGDGIGKEVTPESVKVPKAVASSTNRKIEFIDFDWGANKYLKENISLPDGADRDAPRRVGRHPFRRPRRPASPFRIDMQQTSLLGLRFKLDLYVNARPVELIHERMTPLRDRERKTSSSSSSAKIPKASYIGVGRF